MDTHRHTCYKYKSEASIMLIIFVLLTSTSVVYSCGCAKNDTTPACGVNEEYSKCKITCPPQFCNNSYVDYPPCPKEKKCEPGCNCIKDHLRDFNGICVLNEDCTPPAPLIKCGENEVETICKKTCPPDNCDYDSELQDCRPGRCRRGCDCIHNYLRDSNGKCIPKEQCPKKQISCGSNATYTDCPSPCASTCKTPNEKYCNKQCEPPGCKCNSSYLLSEPRGQCILPKDCPGGNPCPQNETFVGCNIRCPNSYCPVDDSLGILICDPPYPCPSGCGCILNHKRKSLKDPRCILSTECPPVKCTRPNEEWNTCPTSCLKENCNDLKVTNTACKPSYTNCQPRCACKEGFYRNESRICVPASQCFPKETCDVSYECRATCAEPNPKNCSYQSASKNIKGCKCRPGFVLSDKDGECIKIENCPLQLECNGDPNAHITECPPPCPSTCSAPNERPCKMKCLDVGCKCKEGYILSKINGLCVQPENCPGGDPCGKNATFLSCNNNCPYNYCPVDDSPTNYSCSPPPRCPSGCVCRLNHRKKSINDKTCIVASECPPVNCTRPNEVWDSCPPACLQENCKDAGKKKVVCYTFALNCQPQCICKPNTYRNENKICVPVHKCPKKPKTPDCAD